MARLQEAVGGKGGDGQELWFRSRFGSKSAKNASDQVPEKRSEKEAPECFPGIEMGSRGRPEIQKNAPGTPSRRGSENRRRTLRVQSMKTPIVTHFGGVRGTPPGSEKEAKIHTKMPTRPQNTVPGNAPKKRRYKSRRRVPHVPHRRLPKEPALF